MDTSLVIINRSDPRVTDTLEALTALDAVIERRAEVVVVDASAGAMAELYGRFPDVTVVPFTPIPGVVTIPHQRNAGVAAASGDVVVFIDSACIPAPGWLELMTDPIVNGSEKVVTGASKSPHSSLRDEAVDRIAAERYVPEAPTISLAIHRTVFEQVGGFDERFAYGSDVDFTWRVVNAGLQINNVPEAVVVHDWGETQEELDRSWRYGRARARLYLKHRDRWRDLFGRDLPLIAYPAYLLILPLTIRRPWIHLSLALPLYRNRGRRPLASVADHFIRAVAALTEVGAHVLKR